MGNFSFYPLIPAGPNNPSNDQPLMLVNNQSTNSIMAIDHFGFNNANNQGGWHQQSTYPQQVAAPATLIGQLALYSKVDAGSGVNSCLFAIRDNIAGTEVQLTSSAVAAPSRLTNGYTFLPGPGSGANKGGILIQWGFTATPNNGQTTITFPVAFAVDASFAPIVTATPYGVSPTSATGLIYIKSTSNTNFVVNNTDKSGVVINTYWHAIGPI